MTVETCCTCENEAYVTTAVGTRTCGLCSTSYQAVVSDHNVPEMVRQVAMLLAELDRHDGVERPSFYVGQPMRDRLKEIVGYRGGR